MSDDQDNLPIKPRRAELVSFTDGEEAILGMYSADAAGFTFKENDFDIQTELTILMDIARNGEKDGDRVKALTRIRQITDRVAEVNGLIVRAKSTVQQELPDGSRIEATQTHSRLLTQLQGTDFHDKGTDFFTSRTMDPIKRAERGPTLPEGSPSEDGP